MRKKYLGLQINPFLVGIVLLISLVSFLLGRISFPDSNSVFAKPPNPIESYAGCGTPDPNRSDTQPPTITITTPQDGQVVERNKTLTITYIESDASRITKSEIWKNGELYGLYIGDQTGLTFVWKVPAKPGEKYSFQIKACDSYRNYGESPVVTITAQ